MIFIIKYQSYLNYFYLIKFIINMIQNLFDKKIIIKIGTLIKSGLLGSIISPIISPVLSNSKNSVAITAKKSILSVPSTLTIIGIAIPVIGIPTFLFLSKKRRERKVTISHNIFGLKVGSKVVLTKNLPEQDLYIGMHAEVVECLNSLRAIVVFPCQKKINCSLEQKKIYNSCFNNFILAEKT